jgi:phosphoserine phosphatase RsbU/P
LTTVHHRVVPAVLPVLESELTLREVVASVRERLDVDVLTVLQLDLGSHHLVTVVTESATRVPPAHHRVPVGEGLAGRVASTGAPIALEEVGDDDLVNPALLDLGVRAVLGVPVLHEGRVTGVLKAATFERHVFGPDEIALAQDAALEIGAALEEYYDADDRAAAAALQRSLVPTQLPAIPGLELAGRYIPGQGGVSGDWYDVFALPGGHVGMVMGDVAGHGLPASVVMGRLRSALRAYALEYIDPAEVLTHLDAKIMHFEPGAMATVVYAVSEPPYRSIRIACAGHFLPIHVAAGGEISQVDIPVDLPLGVDLDFARSSGTLEIGPGSSLVLFTDGLVERRSTSTARGADVFETIDTALVQLRRLLGPGSAETMASRVLDSMLTIEPPSDDVALLVVRRPEDPDG